MGAKLKVDAYLKTVKESAEATYLGSGDQHLFGWLHRPAAAEATDLGLVICNPFGYEAICANPSLRAFAESAAVVGVSALRFDYRATGHSTDIEPQVDQIDVCTHDVMEAVAELRRRTAVQRVFLIGFRMGGLLASIVATNCCELCGMVPITPVVSCRRCLRQLRTTQSAELPSLGVRKERHGGVCAGGERLPVIPCDHCVARQAQLRKLAATYRALPGMVEMLVTATEFAVVLRHMIALMLEFLLSLSPQPSEGSATVGMPTSVATFTVVCRSRPASVSEGNLRMDLAGTGDSASRSGSRVDDVFPSSAIDDVRSAIGFRIANIYVQRLNLAVASNARKVAQRLRIRLPYELGDPVFNHDDSRAALEEVLDDELSREASLGDLGDSLDASGRILARSNIEHFEIEDQLF